MTKQLGESKMSTHITVVGTIATDPKAIRFANGGSKCTFRLAENERWFDIKTSTWKEGRTNWFTINATRSLGENSLRSFEKGQRVIVSGKLRIREWEKAENKGLTIEVDADSLGHDLRWGVSNFQRAIKSGGEMGSDYNSHHSQASWADSTAPATWQAENHADPADTNAMEADSGGDLTSAQ